jgi:hypothetical protein
MQGLSRTNHPYTSPDPVAESDIRCLQSSEV